MKQKPNISLHLSHIYKSIKYNPAYYHVINEYTPYFLVYAKADTQKQEKKFWNPENKGTLLFKTMQH